MKRIQTGILLSVAFSTYNELNHRLMNGARRNKVELFILMSSTIIETDTCLLNASMNLTNFQSLGEKGEAEMKEKCERIEMFIYELWTTKLTF